MKIKRLKKSETLHTEYIAEFKNLGVTKLAYWYERGSYDGHGFAIFSIGRKTYYHEMGHCSCYGPLEGLENAVKMPVTKAQLKVICSNRDYENAKEVFKAFYSIK